MTMTDAPTTPPKAYTDVPPRKPVMRGWLHLGMTPIIFICGLTLTALAPMLDSRLACALYTLTAVQLFGTSAAYHRGNWKQKTRALFRRMDHSNIFIFIAGTYTPIAVSLLDGVSRWSLLVLIWSLAIIGVAFRMLWLEAPRWLYTILYVAMGWAAVGWLPQLWAAGGTAVVVLIIAGGVVYSLGAIAYGTKRPSISPKWFGFHEVFHSATILAAICHNVAIWLAVFA